jgi:general secretion pathway protein H
MRQRGFTLVEILVAVVIIGIMIAAVTLGLGAGQSDGPLETERDRILAIADQLRDQATLENREYGLRIFDGGYQFLVLDGRTGFWNGENDDLLRKRELSPGLTMKLWIEGRPVVLPDAEVDADQLAPQILLYSSGELNLFELEIRRTLGTGVRIKPAATSDRLEATLLEAEQS